MGLIVIVMQLDYGWMIVMVIGYGGDCDEMVMARVMIMMEMEMRIVYYAFTSSRVHEVQAPQCALCIDTTLLPTLLTQSQLNGEPKTFVSLLPSIFVRMLYRLQQLLLRIRALVCTFS